MNVAFTGDIDALYRIPLATDGPWFFVPLQIGTPAQNFHCMLDTGSSLSWIQTTVCSTTPSLCNTSSKFNESLSSTLIYEPESMTVMYTEGTIDTQIVSDVVTLSYDHDPAKNTTGAPFQKLRSFGVTANISGDFFLLKNEVSVSGFLGASQRRFESDSDLSTHIFADMVRELPEPVFSLTFTDTWGTLTLGGSDPCFFSEPISWVKTLSDESGWVTSLSSTIDLVNVQGDQKRTTSVPTNLDKVWFDSGTTYIWGDKAAIGPLNEWMGADSVTGEVACTTIPSLGSIIFTIGGSDGSNELRIELSPAEYIIGKVSSKRCFTALNASGPSKDHWIFGLHVLRGFYTVYHYGLSLVGIAPYNITCTNPMGRIVLPGSQQVLNHSLAGSLGKTAAASIGQSLHVSRGVLVTWMFVAILHLYF